MSWKRFEFCSGTSNKYWEICVETSAVRVRYGRIGTAGQSQTKPFPTRRDAKDEAERLIRTKLKKGYVEASPAPAKPAARKKAPAQKTPARKKAPARKTAARKRAPARKKVTAQTEIDTFRAEDAKLLDRGWPEMRRLLDQHADDRDPAAAAIAVAEAREPPYGVDWPRMTAERYLHILALKRWNYATTKRVTRARAAAKTEVPGERELRSFLSALLSTQGDHWHYRDALFLFEALLGTGVVVDALLEHFEHLSPRGWKADNPNERLFEVVRGFGYLLLRLAVKPRRAAVRRVRELLAAHDASSLLYEDLDIVVNGARAITRFIASPRREEEYDYDDLSEAERRHCVLRSAPVDFCDDVALVREIAAANPDRLLGVRAVYLGGPVLLDGFDKRMRGAPAYMLRELIEQFAIVRHPGVVELAALLATGRAVRKPALAWLNEHWDYARPHLAALVKTPGKAGEGAALAMKSHGGGSNSAKKPKRSAAKLSERALKTELTKVAKRLVAQMKKARGNQQKERAALTAAVDGYVAVRTDAGNPAPIEFVIHFFRLEGHAGMPAPFDTLGCSEEEDERWTDTLLEIADAY